MSDDAPRSAPSPGQRHSDGAPAWWPELERSDLPEDGVTTATHAEWFDAGERTHIAEVPGIEGMPSRKRAWLINVAAVVVALAVIMFGVGVDSPRSVLVIALLFGVPIVLVVVTATFAARRAR